MKYFVTGATGFIGRRVVQELRRAGHEVLGLSRSQKGADALEAQGVEALFGSILDHDILKKAAASSDGVIHLAFQHDTFTQALTPEELQKSHANDCRIDREAIQAMGVALAGSDKPLIISSGTVLVTGLGRPSTEDDVAPNGPFATMTPRGQSQTVTLDLVSQGVRAMVMRLPPTVHGEGDHGFIPMLIAAAKKKNLSAYIGEGENVWPTTHVDDVAVAYRLAVENGKAGSIFHPIAEQDAKTRVIAERIGERLKIPVGSITPEQGPEHVGFVGLVLGMHNPTSSEKTREGLGWEPKEATLMEDMDRVYLATA